MAASAFAEAQEGAEVVVGLERDIVVVAGSAGAIEPLCTVIGGLPVDFPGVLLVVLHRAPGVRSSLITILRRIARLPVCTTVDGQPVTPGIVVVAPPDHHHTVVGQGRLHLVGDPPERYVRPAADPLFRSAAHEYGPRVVGVVLSGSGSDGADGIRAIVAAGGIAIVQDPAEAWAASMPREALARATVDFVLPAAKIAPLLIRLARGQSDGGATDESHPSPGSEAPTERSRPRSSTPEVSVSPRRVAELREQSHELIRAARERIARSKRRLDAD